MNRKESGRIKETVHFPELKVGKRVFTSASVERDFSSLKCYQTQAVLLCFATCLFLSIMDHLDVCWLDWTVG